MKFILVFATLLIVNISVFGQDSLTRDLQKSFRKYELTRLNPNEVKQKARAGEKIRLGAFGRVFEFGLEAHDLRAPNYRAAETNANGRYELTPGEVTTYKGKLSDEPDSEVRMSLDEHKLDGMIYSARGKYFISKANHFSKHARADEVVIYEENDLILDVDLRNDTQAQVENEVDRLMPQVGFATVMSLQQLEVATEADFQWVTQAGGTALLANTQILGILNIVDGIYQRDLNLTIRVTYQHAWTSTDPLGTESMNALLDSFVSYWNSNFPTAQYPRDAAHLYTGKFSNVGLAYVGVVCRYPSAAYGITAKSGGANALISAHELGHNLGADHVDNSGSCANSMMNPSLSSLVTSFCSVSQSAIASFVSINGGCLTVVTGPTPTPTPTPVPTPIPTPIPTPFPTPIPPSPTGPTSFDFDGDGRADLTNFRPSNGFWYTMTANRSVISTQWGQTGDRLAAEDFNGDGITDNAIFRSGTWYVNYSGGGTQTINWGAAGDIPVPADRNGDGRAEFIVYRPSTGVWYSINALSGAPEVVNWGTPGDIPVIGDYDGDTRADIAVWRPSDGKWYLLQTSAGVGIIQWGTFGDRVVPADYNGDGRTDPAIFRNGTWYVNFGSNYTVSSWGVGTDMPVAADYDGDGMADLAVWRPSTGTWYVLNSSSAYQVVQWGVAGDLALPNYRVNPN